MVTHLLHGAVFFGFVAILAWPSVWALGFLDRVSPQQPQPLIPGHARPAPLEPESADADWAVFEAQFTDLTTPPGDLHD